MVFASALKVYSTFSLRRFMSDMRTAKENGLINRVSSYSSVSNYMRSEKPTSVLQYLISLSAMSLKSVETKFAIDSTGFRTTKFNDYCREKHKTAQYHNWVKAHICTGVKTNIVTGVEVLEGHSADNLQFIILAEKTRVAGFKIKEMSADKAYSGRKNLAYINSAGGVPFIPFKNNTTGHLRGEGGHIWRKMYNFFTFRREEFLQHYHLRSNIESTNNMIKAKFTYLVRSKDKTAQINEVLLKVLCHNLVVLIQETHELGIEPNFFTTPSSS